MTYATLTEDSGASTYSNGIFIDEEKTVADEFVMKFYLSDRLEADSPFQYIYLLGNTSDMAADGGHYWDGTDRTSQFNIALGCNEIHAPVFEFIKGNIMEDGVTNVASYGWELIEHLKFGWNTIKMYFNNATQMWTLAVGDNFAIEYPIPDLPKICQPYNLNNFVTCVGRGDNCVDLAETGFKQNGEWVWRATK